MVPEKKPYLIIPHLIEQPTWGGSYICEKKGWLTKRELKGKKFGQSYELYSKTKLAVGISSTEDILFDPYFSNTIEAIVFQTNKPFPLIKFTQAKGNSFQLHIRPGVNDSYWQPKAESWYFFEPGKMTFGIKKGIKVEEYKKVCKDINNKMKELCSLISEKKINTQVAEQTAKEYIKSQNPWYYVNVYETNKGDVVDLSGGGIHHSWEECPQGNILYEIQQDVMDPVSTIRAFDQGKIKEDGAIREVQIEDYFKHIDLDEKRNTLTIEKKKSESIFNTPHYSLDSFAINKERKLKSSTSFHHLFVKEGGVTILDENNNKLFIGRGHSCFVPQGVNYSITPRERSEVLLTYLQ